MTDDGLALTLTVPPRKSRRIQRGLYDQFRAAILDGRLAAGVQLPASRALATRLHVSRNLIAAIYDLLVSEGYAVSRVGSGTFVAQLSPLKQASRSGSEAHPRPDWLAPAWRQRKPIALDPIERPLFDLRPGIPDIAHFPFDLWRQLSNRALRDVSRGPASYRYPEGLPKLRKAIALHVSTTRALACPPEAVIITQGAQQAFDLLARILVFGKRATVAVENPGYPPCAAAFLNAGARIAPVPVDREGLRPDRLPRHASVICVTPSHQFPTGAAMSAGRRQSLLDAAARMGAVIVEDDYDGEFGFAERPQQALKALDPDGRVFYVGTFSKCMFPALRLGFIVAPEWALQALAAARQAADWYSPILAQAALAEFISEGHLRRHVRRMRRLYVDRRLALLGSISRHCNGLLEPMPGAAGLHLALTLRRPLDMEKTMQALRQRGIALNNLAAYTRAKSPMPGFAIGYGQITADRIDPAIRALREALVRQTPE
jgi:GntR family transcriptional regulator/MocR family aminotransferase